MISVNNVGVTYSTKQLFENVNLKFIAGNCYGIIGANGAGKSTLLKIIAKNEESTSGEVIYDKGIRISVLEQDHFKFDEFTITEAVLSGYAELYSIMEKRNEIYSKSEFTEEDGYLAADLEEKFADLNGYEAESEAHKLLAGLNLKEKDYSKKMKEIIADDKVKVLLARALFGNPDALLLDEPTNHLDFYAIRWLEEFLIDFDKTVLVVSHDRHFLNTVCTHIVDIDYQAAKIYVGNYDFWRQSSELMKQLTQNSNKKKEEQINELQSFIARFSANASKSKQATSRKKMLEKIELDEIKPSSRRYPYINLEIEKPIGRSVFKVENLNVTIEGEEILNDISFDIQGEDKVAFISENDLSISTLFAILSEETIPDSGEVNRGETVMLDTIPIDNSKYFEAKINLVEWLRQYSGREQDESYIRSFLGKMLFSGEDGLKSALKLSGGEKVRMMFAKLMLGKANTLILDQPTNHLDLESIQAVNEGLVKYEGALLFASHDLDFVQTLATKLVFITASGSLTFNGTFEEFLENEELKAKVDEMNKK